MTTTHAEYESIDFYTEEKVTIDDPYPYFEYLRSKGPVWREPLRGVVMVTGWEEAVQIYRDHEHFSSCNTSTGPFYGLIVEPGTDDINDVQQAYHETTPLQFFAFMDPPKHDKYRSLMKRLFTPKRLNENEEFMWRCVDQQLDQFVSRGECEFIHEFSHPFTVLVIADLLGVPEDDREEIRQIMLDAPSTGVVGDRADENPEARTSTAIIMPVDKFMSYIEDRRVQPRDDHLTRLALAKFDDGSTPDAIYVAREAGMLFVAGGETTARLLGSALHFLAENPEFQDTLRNHREMIPNFVEEMLRFESPVKCVHRLARRTTTVGGVEIPAGTTVALLMAAINRDPRHFECPAELRPDRENAHDHVAFSRGIHSCLGMSLARSEARVGLERILDRMADIHISEKHHGPPAARQFKYDPTFVFRGLEALHLEFTPVESPGRSA